jgi:hypothetical protein
MIFLAISIGFFFFMIMELKLLRSICFQDHDAALTEDHPIRRSAHVFRGLTTLLLLKDGGPTPRFESLWIPNIRQGPPTYSGE